MPPSERSATCALRATRARSWLPSTALLHDMALNEAQAALLRIGYTVRHVLAPLNPQNLEIGANDDRFIMYISY